MIRYYIILIRVPGRDYKNKIKINQTKVYKKERKKKEITGKSKGEEITTDIIQDIFPGLEDIQL